MQLKQVILYIFCPLLLVIGTISTSKATHEIGIEMEYEATSIPNQYRIFLTIYRDCNGINVMPYTDLTVDTSGGNTFLLPMTLDSSKQMLGSICPSSSPLTTCAFYNNPIPGTEAYYFSTILTVGSNCPQITAEWNTCCLNSSIVNFSASGSGAFIYINNQFPQQSLHLRKDPIIFSHCVGQPFHYNPEIDNLGGDSIVVYVDSFYDQTLIYHNSWFDVDPSTGAMIPKSNIVTPAMYMSSILVHQYMNGVLIGKAYRSNGIAFLLNCTNNVPEVLNADSLGFIYINHTLGACGDSLSFDIKGYDPDSNGVYFRWDSSLQNASITRIPVTVDTAIGRFTWRPSVLDVGKHIVTVEVRDTACPLIGRNIYTFVINVQQGPASLPGMSHTTNNVDCYGNATGSATVTPSGGSPPYSYHWSDGQSTASATGLTAGTYTVTIVDANSCWGMDTATISQPNGLLADIGSYSNPSCQGCTDGTAQVNPLGGTPPYQYLWSTGDTTALVNTLPNGTHCISLTDANGCQDSDCVLIEELSGQIQPARDYNGVAISCLGASDGALQAVPLGGTTPFSYQWSTGATTASISGLAAGSYSVSITDALGAVASDTFQLTEPTALSINVLPLAAGCALNDGRLTALVSGGTSPYNYLWSNNKAFPIIQGLGPGESYSISVSDANGCPATAGPFTAAGPTIQDTSWAVGVAANLPYSFCIPQPINANNFSIYQAATHGSLQYDSLNCYQYQHQSNSFQVDSFILVACNGSNAIRTTVYIHNPEGSIQGKVVMDDNFNCQWDSTEVGLTGTMVQFQNSTGTFTFNTLDNAGNYIAGLNPGTYTATIIPGVPYFQSCTLSRQVVVDSVYTPQTINWTLQATQECPYLEVDISTFVLSQTRVTPYYVTYTNRGTVPAQNAYVNIDLDPFLDYYGASIPLTSQNGNHYRFNLGTIAVGQSGGFTFTVQSDSLSFAGQTHCTEAHIYPDSICIPNFWNGAEIDVQASCAQDTVFFNIINNGNAMLTARNYELYQDDTLIQQQSYQLGAGQSLQVPVVAASGRTYRLIAQQEASYPALLGDSIATAFVENCNAASPPNISLGHGTSFPNGHSAPFGAIDCRQNVASYDPNDKQAQPVGYGPSHFIHPNTAIDYQVRFQNTGTDTAFSVVILDTLSPYLDPATIVMGSSSHPYDWQLLPGHVLSVSFPGIELPDSNVNEPASQGFVRFRIQQQPNNPIGSWIDNSAAIYFDNNSPIITDTVFHLIGTNFVQSDLTNVPLAQPMGELAVEVFPNPSEGLFTLRLGEALPASLEVWSAAGRRLQFFAIEGQYQHSLDLQHLPKGIYFLAVQTERGRVVKRLVKY